MELKLKDVLSQVKTCEIVKIANHESGEDFYPNYTDLKDYGEWYVIDIASIKDGLLITVQSQI